MLAEKVQGTTEDDLAEKAKLAKKASEGAQKVAQEAVKSTAARAKEAVENFKTREISWNT